jgi:hypothetical protein
MPALAQMFELLLGFVAVGISAWLAIGTVDAIVAICRREWRFSVRSMLMMTAVISIMLGAIVVMIQK